MKPIYAALFFGLILLGNAAVSVVLRVTDADAKVSSVALFMAAAVSGTAIGFFSEDLPDLSRFNRPRRSRRSQHH